MVSFSYFIYIFVLSIVLVAASNRRRYQTSSYDMTEAPGNILLFKGKIKM